MTEVTVAEELAELRAFANTLDVEQGSDEIADAAGLQRWLVERALLPASEPVTAADVAAAQALRTALRSLVADDANDADVSAAATAADALAAGFPLRLAFSADGDVRLVPLDGGVRGALAAVLAEIPAAVASGSWARLKLCAADDCQWVFYDQSKNRSRRWCSMAVCGNRAKTRAFRGRRD